MRSLRYWLGLPLFNLILLILFSASVIFPGVRLLTEICLFTVYAMMIGGAFVLPLITALWYPVKRDDCRPLYKTALISWAMISVAWIAAFSLSAIGVKHYDFLYHARIALIFTTVQSLGYSLGLFIVKTVAERGSRARTYQAPKWLDRKYPRSGDVL